MRQSRRDSVSRPLRDHFLRRNATTEAGIEASMPSIQPRRRERTVWDAWPHCRELVRGRLRSDISSLSASDVAQLK